MTDVSAAKLYPAPVIDPETKPFWDACAEGRLLIKHCLMCDERHYPPRALCPFCFSDNTAFEQSKGEGEIYTFSVMRRSPTGPFAIGYVSLDEGPAVLTNFVDCDFDQLAIGQRVAVKFAPAEGGVSLPVFAPVKA
ncbi:OB-fold domain-containing protein [soil metagenome]